MYEYSVNRNLQYSTEYYFETDFHNFTEVVNDFSSSLGSESRLRYYSIWTGVTYKRNREFYVSIYVFEYIVAGWEYWITAWRSRTSIMGMIQTVELLQQTNDKVKVTNSNVTCSGLRDGAEPVPVRCVGRVMGGRALTLWHDAQIKPRKMS